MTLYSQSQLASQADVPAPTICLHVKRGLIPAPTVPVGRHRYYDEVGKDAVLAFYETWVPFKRYKPQLAARRAVW